MGFLNNVGFGKWCAAEEKLLRNEWRQEKFGWQISEHIWYKREIIVLRVATFLPLVIRFECKWVKQNVLSQHIE